LLIAGPAYQQAGKPFLSIGATDPALPDVVGDQIFLACFGDNAQAAAAAEFAHAEFGGTTVILWDSTTPYTRMLPKYFRTRFAQLGGTVLLDRSFEGCDLGDAGRMIAELPDEPAFVYLAAMPDCAGEQVASLRAAGVALPIIGGDGLDTPHLLSNSHGPTDDVWFTTHAWLSAETGTARAKAFVHAYENAYGHPPGDAFAALGYDSALLLLDAVGRAQGTSPAEVHAALEGTRDFEGVTGTISYGPHRHVPSKTVWIIHVEDGQQSLEAALVPKSVPPPVVAE
jgi:branched-chain amino acid transport system substrate-binding protein